MLKSIIGKILGIIGRSLIEEYEMAKQDRTETFAECYSVADTFSNYLVASSILP